MSAPPFRIVLAGVGGQGVLSAARFLAIAGDREGHPVAAGQLHGMAQRGGSVSGTVVFGSESSIIAEGSGDALLATEPLEALRSLPLLRAGGLVLVDVRPLVPASLALARAGYPAVDTILAALAARAGTVIACDATALAAEAGSAQVVNVVMLGMLCGSGRAPVTAASLLAVILESCAPATRTVNQRAFELGRSQSAPARATIPPEETPCRSP